MGGHRTLTFTEYCIIFPADEDSNAEDHYRNDYPEEEFRYEGTTPALSLTWHALETRFFPKPIMNKRYDLHFQMFWLYGIMSLHSFGPSLLDSYRLRLQRRRVRRRGGVPGH
jgi:hypothetical protein